MSSLPPGPGDNRATVALTIGIASVVLTLCCGPLAIGGGIAAAVIARQVQNDARQYGLDSSTATTAFWVGVAAVVLGAASMLLMIVLRVWG